MLTNHCVLLLLSLSGISALGEEVSLRVLDQLKKDIDAGKSVEQFFPSFRDKDLKSLKLNLELELAEDEVAYTLETEEGIMVLLGFSGNNRLSESEVRKFLKGEKIAKDLKLSYLRFSMRPPSRLQPATESRE